jgi:hypothetical protein
MYEFLEAEGIGYTIRLPANSILQSKIGYLLKRRTLPGRKTHRSTSPSWDRQGAPPATTEDHRA